MKKIILEIAVSLIITVLTEMLLQRLSKKSGIYEE